MPTSLYLANPQVTIAGTDMSDQCTAATLTRVNESLENTSFGATARSYTSGLQNNEVTVTMYQSYATGETYDTLKAIVGTTTTIIIKPTTAADGPTNPGFTLTGCYLETLPNVSASLGELSTIDLTFTGGVYTADITP
jgi:hypothetical protein